MSGVFLLLGSNLGNRLSALSEARNNISRTAGKIITHSSVFRTAAWGDKAGAEFYNQVVELLPASTPKVTLTRILEIEKAMGRERVEKWGDRIIDIDILLWNNMVLEEPDLVIPHPFLHMRRFALAPLAELAPAAEHPVLKKTISVLLAECSDPLAVAKLTDTTG